MDWLNKIQMRIPYESEKEYFRSNPNVAGMAAEDDAVVLNPFSNLSQQQRVAVIRNEAARIFMRKNNFRPNFGITDSQRKMFGSYGNEQDIRETIAARIFSDDPSAGESTTEQIEYVNRFLKGNR